MFAFFLSSIIPLGTSVIGKTLRFHLFKNLHTCSQLSLNLHESSSERSLSSGSTAFLDLFNVWEVASAFVWFRFEGTWGFRRIRHHRWRCWRTLVSFGTSRQAFKLAGDFVAFRFLLPFDKIRDTQAPGWRTCCHRFEEYVEHMFWNSVLKISFKYAKMF